MRTLHFLLVVCGLSFAGLLKAEQDGSGDPDDSERLHYTEDDLPKDEKDPAGESEIDEFARRRGFNYARVTRRAARGHPKALKQFFSMAEGVDGAAAESYRGTPEVVYHLLGDEKFAQFLNSQPLAFRMMVRNYVVGDGSSTYFRRHFPEAAKALFVQEMVAWPSPNKQYAIRKVFSDAATLAESKVERAELIDQKSGQVLYDLTPDDIGVGADREGEVLWSPDSKRFAYRSSDLTQYERLFSIPRPTPKRKQTAVYQLSGESFTRVDLNLTDVPGRENDAELKGAIVGQDYIEPLRWEKPNVLLLERHEYFRKLGPTEVDGVKFESIHDLSRWYRITATIAADGKAAVIWKLRKDR